MNILIRTIRFAVPAAIVFVSISGPVSARGAESARPTIRASPLVRPASVPCSGDFTVTTENRIFDGGGSDIVILHSADITFESETYGAWTPLAGAPHFTLRHRRLKDVRLALCLLDRTDAPRSDQIWGRYLSRVQSALGESAKLVSQSDSAHGPPAVGIGGRRTREVYFIVPAINGAPSYAELHLVMADEKFGVAFVLSGPAADVESATPDFRFFISRLAAVK